MQCTVLVIAAVGVSGSGKTVTLEYLISHLSSEGLQIGSIKHVHHKGFTMDKEGTNTWRYAKAGAKVIVIALLENEKLDIVFIEGFHSLIAKRPDVPKIITAKNQEGLEETLQGTVEPVIAVTGIVAKDAASTMFGAIPIIKIPEDGQKLIALVKEQLAKSARKPAN